MDWSPPHVVFLLTTAAIFILAIFLATRRWNQGPRLDAFTRMRQCRICNFDKVVRAPAWSPRPSGRRSSLAHDTRPG